MQRRLVNAGLSDQLAGAITREIADSIADEIAAKPDLSDLQEVRNELKAEIAELRNEMYAVRNELKAEIAELREEVRALREEVHAIRNELKAEILAVRAEIAQLESRFAEIANEIAGLRNTMADSKVTNIRWATGIIGTIALGFVGVIVALVLV